MRLSLVTEVSRVKNRHGMLKGQLLWTVSKCSYSRIHLTGGPLRKGFLKQWILLWLLVAWGKKIKNKKLATTKQDEKVLKMITWRRE